MNGSTPPRSIAVYTFGRLVEGKTKSMVSCVVIDSRGEKLHDELSLVAPPPAATEIRGMLVSWLACERALEWVMSHRALAGKIQLFVDHEQLAGYISWKSRALHPAFREVAARIDAMCTELGIDRALKVKSAKNRARF